MAVMTVKVVVEVEISKDANAPELTEAKTVEAARWAVDNGLYYAYNRPGAIYDKRTGTSTSIKSVQAEKVEAANA